MSRALNRFVSSNFSVCPRESVFSQGSIIDLGTDSSRAYEEDYLVCAIEDDRAFRRDTRQYNPQRRASHDYPFPGWTDLRP